MKLYLIRHGETDWNLEQRFQGMADIPLNASGRQQAQWVAARFETISFQHIFSSDLSRAYETAQIIAQLSNIPIQSHLALREINVGDWQGYTWTEIQEKFPEHTTHQNPKSIDDASHHGESIRQFYLRVSLGMNDILNRIHNEDTVVVTHGGTIRMILCYLLKLPLEQRDQYKISNVGVFILERDRCGDFHLLQSNDTRHVPQQRPALIGDDRNV